MKYSAFAETIQGITLVQEADSLPTIYCDMDGVLCDFRKGIENMFKLKSKDPSMPGPMQTAGYSDVDDWAKAPNSAPKCCLLYTSPSPRDLYQSRMPSSA